MKIEVNISKTYLFIIVGAILVLAGSVYVYAGVNEALPWHSASQVKMSNGIDSVEDAIADARNYADSLNTFTPGDFIIAEVDSVSYVGNAEKIVKTFIMYLDKLQKLAPKQPYYLNDRHQGEGHFLKKWNLIVPEEVYNKTWEEVL